MGNKINLSYVSDLDSKEDKQRMYDEYLACRGVLLKLSKILHKKTESMRKKQLAESSYDSPSWSEKQADANGYQRALNEVITNLLPTPVGEEK